MASKFRSAELQPLIEKLEKASRAIYLAVDSESVGRDISTMLTDAADSLKDARDYYGAVEAALA